MMYQCVSLDFGSNSATSLLTMCSEDTLRAQCQGPLPYQRTGTHHGLQEGNIPTTSQGTAGIHHLWGMTRPGLKATICPTQALDTL